MCKVANNTILREIPFVYLPLLVEIVGCIVEIVFPDFVLCVVAVGFVPPLFLSHLVFVGIPIVLLLVVFFAQLKPSSFVFVERKKNGIL